MKERKVETDLSSRAMRNSLRNFNPSYRIPRIKQPTIEAIKPPIVEILQKSNKMTSL